MSEKNDDPLPEVNANSLPVRIAKDELVDEFERPRGIFTEVDRRYLSGFKEYEYKQSETNRRRGIRERLLNAFHDFRLLSWVSDRERSKVFDEIDAGRLHDDLVFLLSFVYRGIGRDREAIEQVVQSAIFRVEAENDPRKGYHGGIADVSVDIDVEYGYDAEEIYERLQGGQTEQLTPAEIGVLVRAGMLDEDTLAQLTIDPDQDTTSSAPVGGTPWYLPDDSHGDSESD